MNGEHGYFEEALSDFVFDMASGGAIKHLADRGYSVDQIMTKLEFPTPRERVEKTVYRHMMDTGMLRTNVEEEGMSVLPVRATTVYEMNHILSDHILVNGEDNSYMSCPFGRWIRKEPDRLLRYLSCLTGREKEYIMGILWEQDIMYHILNSRMTEIGVQLAVNSELDIRFYFLKEKIIFRS